MAFKDITEAITTEMNEVTYTAGQEPWNKNLDTFTIDKENTESNTYQTDWVTWHGIYRNITEVRVNIDTISRWILGKKLIMSPTTRNIVKKFKGNGIDNIRKILYNMKRVSKICGDAYAEAPRDKAGRLMNLKILDSGTIEIQADEKGKIVKYVQKESKNLNQSDVKATANASGETDLIEWEPHEIFHVANGRIGDEIHGIPDPESLQSVTKWRNQVMSTYSVVMQRYLKPTYFFEVNTDDTAEMADIGRKIDSANKNFENVILPEGTLKEVKQITTSAFNSSLDPMPWLTTLKKHFNNGIGVADIIQGEGRESATAAANLIYISYKERIIQDQIDYSEDIKSQLGLDIKFEEPPTIIIEAVEPTEETKTNQNENKKKIETSSN